MAFPGRITQFDKKLKQSNIPIDGVRQTSRGEIVIDFKDEATQAQIAQANILKSQFDFTEPVLKSREALKNDIKALSEQDRSVLSTAIINEFILERLQHDTQWAIDLGVSISGEQ